MTKWRAGLGLLHYPAPLAFALVVGIVFLYAGWFALQFPVPQRLVPFLIIAPGLALSLLVVIRELRAPSSGRTSRRPASSWRSDAVRFGWVGTFMLLVTALGFLVGAAIGVFAYAWRAGERPLTCLVLAASAAAVVILFEWQLQLRFPGGLLVDIL